MFFIQSFGEDFFFFLLFCKTVFYTAVEETGPDSVLKVSLTEYGEWQLRC